MLARVVDAGLAALVHGAGNEINTREAWINDCPSHQPNSQTLCILAACFQGHQKRGAGKATGAIMIAFSPFGYGGDKSSNIPKIPAKPASSQFGYTA